MAWVHFEGCYIQTGRTLYFGTDDDGKNYAFFAEPEGRLDFRVLLYDLETAATNINNAISALNAVSALQEPAFVQLGQWWVNPENISYLKDVGDSTTFLFFSGPDQVPYYRRQILSPIDAVSSAVNASIAAVQSRPSLVMMGTYRVNPASVEYATAIDASNTSLTFAGPSSSVATFRITVPIPIDEVISQFIPSSAPSTSGPVGQP